MRRPTKAVFRIACVAGIVAAVSTTSAVGEGATDARPGVLSATQRQVALAATLPSGFQESIAISGLTLPTNFRFASDGRIFVAEKTGLVKVFDSLDDTTPTTFADLRSEVDDYWDRGLLGLALDPNFPASPYVYVSYTYDAEHVNDSPPRWHDTCPTPPGPTTDGCVVTARLSRLTADGDTMTGNEKVLLAGWCQQFPSHSIGDLQFGPDGALYVSAGDGASFTNVDAGQWGGSLPNTPTPKNPCGDPPAGVGGNEVSPTAAGGALRSLSLHRAAGPTLLNGTVLRVDPATGAAHPDNPLAASSSSIARRIVAEGLRNPFRFALRPGTDDLWIGDVGWNDWEEINRHATPKTSVANFGWPCYEGAGRQPVYENFDLTICNDLYGLEGSNPPDPSKARAPYFTYNHDVSVASGDGCTTGSSAVSGIAFYESGSYPSSYAGALFFADHSRNCIWVMPEGGNGLPSPALRAPFVSPAAGPVDLQIGPGGDLFYAGYDDGTIRRIQYFSNNQPPIVTATASATFGALPLSVQFDASASHDPDTGDTLSYSWDLNGDGTFGDSTSATPTHQYQTAGIFHPSVRVSDDNGGTTRSSLFTIFAGDTPPVPVIDTPAPSFKWAVGNTIAFSGHAGDAEDGGVPPTRLSWSVIMHHCPSNCHTHEVETIPGVAGGSFSAPDHDYPSYLELKLTATDAQGLSASASVNLNPKKVVLTLNSRPGGRELSIGTVTATTPFTHTVIVGSANAVSAPNQSMNGTEFVFRSWSDGGAQTHTIVAPAAPTTFTAKFANHQPVAAISAHPISGKVPLTVRFDGSQSSDPDGDKLTFSWDLNGDGVFGDSNAVRPTRTYKERGRITVQLRVRDDRNGSDTARIVIQAQRR